MKNIIHIPVAIMLFSFTVGCNNDQKQRKMETQVSDYPPKTTTVISNDGTAIAYEKMGKGPGIIVVNGALSHRQSVKDLATLLSKDFTVIIYDRRGRGESGDTKPYSVEREIEDIEALVDDAGGSAYLFGSSSWRFTNHLMGLVLNRSLSWRRRK